MSKFETKKKLLVAESEVYRQLLKLELQTFKVYTRRTTRRLTSVTSFMRFGSVGLPLLMGLFARRKNNKSPVSSLKRMSAMLMFGWKTYQRFRPFFGRFGRNRGRVPEREPANTAAEEYLSKRL
jgi:hypothetical protein